MVAARVKDGGGSLFTLLCYPLISSNKSGNASETYLRCLDAVRGISCATLFTQVNRIESVQAMSECAPLVTYGLN